MKKLLLTLLLSLFLIPNVNADEIDSCYNKYLYQTVWYNYYSHYDVNTDSWIVYSYSNSSKLDSLQILFPVEPNKTYYIKSFTGTDYESTSVFFASMHFYDNNKTYLSTDTGYGTYSNYQISFTTPNNESIRYISFDLHNAIKDFLGDTIAFADFNLSTCPVVEEPEPEPEPIIPDTTLDNFYSIYVTKLKEFSQYALENKYFLGTLAIILLFIILEIILNLFRKGGYR